MSFPEKALGGMWGLNLAAVVAAGAASFGAFGAAVGHCLGILLLYSATFFLFAPLHVLIALCVWTAYCLDAGGDGALRRAAVRLFSAETLVFWALYWGMILEFVPLHLRL
ncbi:MAG: hypothetical protein M0D55_06025 [Elusimicrobiota bacterium]|nr:MAG: hypothetical protein M0D55_06025 [Elusimicrobiota bacterium]